MAISEKIKKLINTLGGSPKGDTIEEVLEDFIGLFEEKRDVKMVEIVPEQSVTGIYNETAQAYMFSNPNFKQLNIGTTYNVSINGVVYKADCTGDEVIYYLTVFDGNKPIFNYAKDDVEAMFEDMSWVKDFGETITLAIYEEQEVVTLPVVNLGSILLIVTQDRSNNTFIWEQDYTFDEIYERALKGRRILQVRFINSLETPDGVTWDMAKTYLPLGVSNEHHENGRGVVFYGDGMTYYWSENGFVFSYDD